MNDISDISTYNDTALLQEIGGFIKSRRIALNLTQGDLAEQAAISRSTLSLIERGKNIALTNLIKILRVLDVLHVLEVFRVQPHISPLQLAREEAKKRKRATKHNQQKNEGDIGW